MADPKSKPAPLINYAGNVILEGEVSGGREEWGAHGGVLGRSEIVHLSGGKKQKVSVRSPSERVRHLAQMAPEVLREWRKKRAEGLRRYWVEVKSGKRKRVVKRKGKENAIQETRAR